MKSNVLFFMLFVLIMFFISGLQIVKVVYSPSESFDTQIERQLVSVVQIKGERINDYFLERIQDVEFVAGSVEVRELLNNEVGYDEVVESNIKRKLEVVAGQVEIFMEKYPDMNLEELRADEEFMGIVSQKFGERSGIFFEDDLSLNYVIYEDEFKVGCRMSASNRHDPAGPEVGCLGAEELERFVELGEYDDLVLIDEDGFVVYGSGMELGRELEFAGEDFGNIYSSTKSKGSMIYGPYMREGVDGFDMVLAFGSLTEKGEVVVLFDDMEFLDEIMLKESGLGDSGAVYLLNNEMLLISSFDIGSEARNSVPSKMGAGAPSSSGKMVQGVSNENSEKCFEKKNSALDFSEIISRSYGLDGDESLGTYAYIEEVDWCLISEIGASEVFELPKKGKVERDVYFVIGFNLVLLGIGVYLIRRKFFR